MRFTFTFRFIPECVRHPAALENTHVTPGRRLQPDAHVDEHSTCSQKYTVPFAVDVHFLPFFLRCRVIAQCSVNNSGFAL
jgi:hypothetical protein